MLFLSLTTPASAITLTVTSSVNVADNINYSVLINNWSAYDPRRTNCGGQINWRANICHIQVYYRMDTGKTTTSADWFLEASQTTITVGMMVDALRYRGIHLPRTQVVSTPRSANVKCIGLRYYNHDYNSASQQPPQDLATCVPIVLPPVVCDLNGDTTINHKTILENAINGAQASTQLNLVCKGSASVTLKATRTNSYGVRLRGDDSLYSEVKINGKDATNGISVQAISNLNSPINITSTLKARGAVAPGPFSGSTVITVSPL